MGMRANTADAVYSNLPWFDPEFAFGSANPAHDYRPTAEELARTKVEVESYLSSHLVTLCPTRYATITQACVQPTLPAMPLKRRKLRRPIRRRPR